MPLPKLSKQELQILDVLWTNGVSSIREIQQALPGDRIPGADSTVQTMVYRLENKKALRRAKKISNAHLFEAVISRSSAQRRWVGDFIGVFKGGMKPLMTHLIETGMLSLDDVQDAERTLRDLCSRSGKRNDWRISRPLVAIHPDRPRGSRRSRAAQELQRERSLLALVCGHRSNSFFRRSSSPLARTSGCLPIRSSRRRLRCS